MYWMFHSNGALQTECVPNLVKNANGNLGISSFQMVSKKPTTTHFVRFRLHLIIRLKRVFVPKTFNFLRKTTTLPLIEVARFESVSCTLWSSSFTCFYTEFSVTSEASNSCVTCKITSCFLRIIHLPYKISSRNEKQTPVFTEMQGIW